MFFEISGEVYEKSCSEPAIMETKMLYLPFLTFWNTIWFDIRAFMSYRLEFNSLHKRPSLTQCGKRFATASTSTRVALLLWRYVAEMGTPGSLSWSLWPCLKRCSPKIMKNVLYWSCSCIYVWKSMFSE